ncbi:MAG: gliding motility-associated C-terminal domain-containing protein [Bacteroidota bacterium]|nr:gliding motility-associated C-terminal domain-containing protein [Bacteroidota bacterium]
MLFVQNKGQWADQVKFRADVIGATVFLENEGFTWVKLEERASQVMHDASHMSHEEREAIRFNGHAWKMNFVDPSSSMEIITAEAAPFYHNYFLGNDRSKWASKVPLFGEVRYQAVWPGIDMVLRSHEGHLKYDLVVAANSDIATIAFSYDGVDDLSIGDNGELLIRTTVGDVNELRPEVFYADGANEKIKCQYELKGNVLRFAFPEGYDKNRAIVIDPVLVAATVSGTGVNTFGHCATFDELGNIYTGARAFGPGYITTPGAFQMSFGGGGVDIAISKFDPTGSELLYGTYIGGSQSEYPHSLIVDDNFQLWVLGTTESSDYPITSGAYDVTHNGEADIVITKLTEDGQELVGSTFFGGSASDGRNSHTNNYGDDYRGEIIIDAAGNALVATCTFSVDLPVTGDAVQPVAGGDQDGLVFSLNSTLTSLLWATYLGGSVSDVALGLRISTDGSVVVAGGTASTDFPTTGDAPYPAEIGGGDAFVLRMDATANGLIRSTYWGTVGTDDAFFIDLDTEGNIYIYGQTTGQIPIQPEGTYGTLDGRVFVAKFDQALTSILMSTSVGEAFTSDIAPIAFMVDICSRRIFISGHGALGPVSGMPTTPDNFQSTGGFYVAAFEQNMSELLFGTYYGASGDHVDGGTSRFDPKGVVYQGVCTGGGFPTTPWAYSNASPPGYDVAVFKIDMEQAGLQVEIETESLIGCIPATFNLVAGGNSAEVLWDLGDGSPVLTGTSISYTYEEVGSYIITLIGIDTNSCSVNDTTMITVTVSDGSPAQAAFEAEPSGSCFGFGAQFNNTSTSATNLTWNFGDGETSNMENPFHEYVAPGTYNVWLNIEDEVCGGTDSVLMAVVIPPPSMEYELQSPLYLCDGASAMLDAGSGYETYSWSTGATAQMINVIEPGEYIVDVTEGICEGRDTIHVFEVPDVAKLNDLLGCPGLDAELAVPFATNEIIWSNGENTPSIEVSETGTYWFTAIDEMGCTRMDTVEVVVIPEGQASVMIPNVFSPNGDGQNDRFQVTSLALEQFSMEVYNRWGQMMYSTSNPTNGWNGGKDNSANENPDGTYFYIISFKDLCSDEPRATHHGHVTLLR